MTEHDSRHWWYVARRDILADYVERYARLPKGAKILEIGCGTGHNLPMLGQFGEVDAIEIDAAAREIAARRLGKPVGAAPLPELSGVERGSYDMIAVLDVVEHIEDDVGGLRAMAACLKPGGKILITVPAHQWMWSAHDVVNHHKRRYSKRTLTDALRAAGLQWRKLGYFNSLLFPVAVAARIAGKLTGKDDSDDSPPVAPLNSVLGSVFRLERHLLGRMPLPPGLSLILIAEPQR